MRNKFLGTAVLCVLSACSSLKQTERAATTGDEGAIATAASTNVEGKSLSGLPRASLPEKSCGMVLWTLDERRPTPVFRYVADEKGEIIIGDTAYQLHRTDYSGASGFGVFETQNFTSAPGFENDLSVIVTAHFGTGFDNGAYLERGVIKVVGGDGWSIVTPAAGIAGCRSG